MKSSAAQPTFAEKRQQWFEALDMDHNSIINQLVEMAFDIGSFKVINEARKLAPRGENGMPAVNPLMHRLNDPSPFGGIKGVYSVTSLLRDMKAHSSLLTRKAILDFEMPIGPLLGARNEQLDELFRAKSNERGTNDALPPDILDTLDTRVSAGCQSAKEQVDKFIAHAATAKSRRQIGSSRISFPWNDLLIAFQTLHEVVGFVARDVFGGSQQNFLLTVESDAFEYLDHSLITASDRTVMEQLWCTFKAQCAGWGAWKPARMS